MALEADQVPMFGVTVTAGEAGPVIGVSGEIDLASAPYLGDALTAAIDTGQGPVVVNLAEVTFMDSTGLGVLVFAHNRLAREERQLQLRSPSARVMRVVEVSGLGQLLQIDGLPSGRDTNGSA